METDIGKVVVSRSCESWKDEDTGDSQSCKYILGTHVPIHRDRDGTNSEAYRAVSLE